MRLLKLYILSYKPFNSTSRTYINFYLFGRLIYKNTKGRKISYYTPGILDNIHFSRLAGSKIALKSLDNLELDKLKEYGEISTEEVDFNEAKLFFETAKDHWERVLLTKKDLNYAIKINKRAISKYGRK